MGWPLSFVANLVAYIDGFNFYYGAVKHTPYKWINFRSLLQDLFRGNTITDIKYFTARIKPRRGDKDKSGHIRQQIYWRALQTIPGLSIIEGSFLTKPKNMAVARAHRYPIRAAICRLLSPDLSWSKEDGILLVRVEKTEEKGSDVNLAAHLIHDAHLGRFDEAVVVSGDSDLCDAIHIVVREIGKPVIVLNPQTRTSRELIRAASHYRHIHESELKRNLFPDILADGKGTFSKPREWAAG
jgi:uncharacterized LabA/DUF88 family protein